MKTEALVVGGGLAGAAVAIALARAGRQVLLAERTLTAQHKVCGEFLSAEALGYLAQLGVDVAALGGVPIRKVRLLQGKRGTEAALPFAAMSLTRRALDEALLRVAESAGAAVRRGAVVSWTAEAGGDRFAVNGETVEAADVFLAAGKHDLARLPRPAGRQQGLVGVKMYLRLQPGQAAALRETVELVAYAGGYGGLQPVEDGVANLCCLVPRAWLQQERGDVWPRLLAKVSAASTHLAERLDGAEPLLERPLAVAPIPYGYVRREALAEKVWALGDQAAVIPSFTGDGMSLALHSAALAARMFLRGESAAAFQRKLCEDVKTQVQMATLVSRSLVRFPSLAMTAARLHPALLHGVARRTRIEQELLLTGN